MRSFASVVAVLLVVGGAAFWWLSAPVPLAAADVPTRTADVANGERLFNVGGCASCHHAPDAEDDGRLVLAGGQTLETPLGGIVVPNISPHPTAGIGGWSTLDLANALLRGISPSGTHYTPAFPWTSYRNMRPEEVVDLKAYLDTLPQSANVVAANGMPFPFSWRRPIGLWKRFAMTDPPAAPAGADPMVERGYRLVISLGHCGECHTPRTALLAMDPSRWLAGAPDPDGNGQVPSITPTEDGIGGWSAGDIAYLLQSGFTPEFDSVGGSMSSVVANWAKAPAEDREAVAAYLKALSPE